LGTELSDSCFLISDVKHDVMHIYVNTVDSLKHKYTAKEHSDACKAWSLQDINSKTKYSGLN